MLHRKAWIEIDIMVQKMMLAAILDFTFDTLKTSERLRLGEKNKE